MHILLQSSDTTALQQINKTLAGELQQAGLSDLISCTDIKTHTLDDRQKGGELITIGTIILASVSAGGLLTVAMGKDGFFTQLARVLEKIAEQKIEVTIKTSNGEEIRLSGSAGHIRKILEQQKQI